MQRVEKNISENELKVMKCVAQGMSNKEIGQTLYLTESSIKKYIHNILGKLEMRDRTQLAIYVIKNNIDE